MIQNPRHAARRHYLVAVCADRLAADPTNRVLEDVLVDWDVPGLRSHAPDVAIVRGARPVPAEEQPSDSFDVAKEGVRPRLVIELTSPGTAHLDLDRKLTHYALARVDHYVIVVAEPEGAGERLELKDYRLVEGRYQEVATDEHGRVWLEAVGVWLGVDGPRVVCYDETGAAIPDYTGQVAARTEAEQRAAAAATARAAADRARAAAERRAADEAVARAEAERRAADESAARVAAEQARMATEARLRALEEELRRLRGQ